MCTQILKNKVSRKIKKLSTKGKFEPKVKWKETETCEYEPLPLEAKLLLFEEISVHIAK